MEKDPVREGVGKVINDILAAASELEAAAMTRLCAVCGAEAPEKSRCGLCLSVSYCSRQHQVQHWKTGGHREACTANCTRCLEPMWSNDGECSVDHPSHLRKESEKLVWSMVMPDVTKTAVCRACDQELTIKEGVGCRDCTRDCGFIVGGPKVCFEGKHTSGPLPASDKRRVWKGVVTIRFTENLQGKIEEVLSPEKEAKVRVLNFPNGGCEDKITASIHHRMSNLTTLRIMDVTLTRLQLNAELTPNLLELEIRNIPENCKFQVVVPTLKMISIHHYTPPEHKSHVINDMLAAASELEKFETYKLRVTEVLHFASNDLKTIELYRSDGLSGISFWAPNLETLTLRACYCIERITILESHLLAEKLPEGHKPTTIRVNTLNANISSVAMAALEGSGRCLIEDNEPDDGPLGTEAMFKFMHTFDSDGPEGMMRGAMAWSEMQLGEMDKKEKKKKKKRK